MTLRLVVLSGPLVGATFPLGAEGLTLGRDRESGVRLRDLAVSRHHCVIEPAEDAFRVRDLDSRHGTFVNGIPVRERTLRPGDRIALGDSLFLVQGDEPASDPADRVLLEDRTFAAQSTVQRPADGSPYLQLDENLPPSTRVARDLHALLRIGHELHSLRATAPLARRFLDLLLQTMPAERAALLLLDRAGQPGSSFALDRAGSVETFPLSRTLVERLLSERKAVLSNDLQMQGLSESESLQAARIVSILATPLLGASGPLGVLYLDTREPGTPFDENHLDLLTALAGIASLALANSRHMEWLEEEKDRLEAALDVDMVGESPRMHEIWRLLARVAASDSTVLLRGESGTGKELAARTLHRQSRRANRPFVAINCATLSHTLLESELFGHERGAFTGALERKIGKFEVADTGTLFLDEVGEIPPPLQARLLRVLQEREFERVGNTRPIRVDVRVIAATNRDLEKAIREGDFREDLFYRLNVISCTLPPLRERREDIPLLASHFAARFGRQLGRRVAGFTPEARACLERYAWPGNVRELSN
ncbi:MAG TPA: sigma 54-interacting transcriptional regulator, partial [Thermoanaerobaculia bacterium]|nr:sigma 54-interacting transcriptional regulator [Thermoanaerobaculia bacterium]